MNLNKINKYFVFIFLNAALLQGCINFGTPPDSSLSAKKNEDQPKLNSSQTSLIFKLIKVIATLANQNNNQNTQEPPQFKLIFNADNPNNNLHDVCQVQTENNADPSRACKCDFTWPENNISDASVIMRTAQTEPKLITNFEVECPGPAVYNAEIPDNTIIKISLVADYAKGNSSGFASNSINFTKEPLGSTGDFRDAEGRSYRNVFHYSCYDKQAKPLAISQKIEAAVTNPNTNQEVQAKVANYFSTSSTPNYSGQSYYYDFYVRSNEAGSINASNDSFTCPMVNMNGVPSFYPMDSSFAVALQASKDFPLSVPARIFIPIKGNPAAGVILGYAALPNTDGSCPAFKDFGGKIRRTFRLRQYSAVYPMRYQANGDASDVNGQSVNIVYVLDRPVERAEQDPLKPITRLGPKPCPFSYKTAQFGQKCMTDATLSGFNIDGTQIPGDPSCPIYPPVKEKFLQKNGTFVIRPYKPFTPHYIENKRFRACAFQSSTPVDPEIVLSHDDNIFPGNNGPADFYCARHYPPTGAILPPLNGDPFDKAPGACDVSMDAASIKTDKSYACSRTYDPTNSALNTPAAGCCQICSGPDCTNSGGGVTAKGRNAAFSPPVDLPKKNPDQAFKLLPRAIPNKAGGGGCFDPYEN